ncbi:Ca2+-binding RTX toxin-like protein [Rhizobium sp. SG_E_25_P2]|uniref:calcium-binding protein n=1 Tax=Rhizobium sp. SG_E_25_P2 TaxID=2879942 RepID=UPI0024752315|nr:calcium-binding protein [Rhizobium sp. SG_E_25_P2]MDH6268414.1 Ca2+-binding RTX toxin-like protein [Rhizobium sp. SG_E_25_P2]
MSLKSVLAAVNIDKDFSDADEKAILAVIREAYKESSIGREMLEDWVTGAGQEITVNYEKGAFYAYLNSGDIYIDLDELDNAHYIDRHGNAVKDTPFTAIIHELGHALEGYEDNWTIRNPAGDNQAFVNTIYAQAGYTRQLAYMAYDASGEVIQAGVSYTDGKRIDNAWAHKWSSLPDNYDTTNGGKITEAYRDLVIGSNGANVLKTGAGADFIYGLEGADRLLGGDGGDVLAGGQGADRLSGAGGVDFASYKLAAKAVTADLSDASDNSGEAKGDVYNAIEGLIGSVFADFLSGDDGRNTLEGRSGADRLDGGKGNDTLIGGAGRDRAIFSGDHDDYVIDLDTLVISGGGEGRDTLKGVELAVFDDGVVDLATGDFMV